MTVAEVTVNVQAAVDAAIKPEQIQEVRGSLSEELHAECDDATVQRFIRATGGNLQLAAKRLQATAAWRHEVKPEAIVCKACAKDPRAHYMHLTGFDLQHRPVIYSCNGLASNKSYEDNRDHMISTFETAIKCMPAGVEQWVWVCDFHGFGLRDINPKLAKLFLDISADHYPERLGLFIILDAPKLFSVLWATIEKFVDPKTHKKIRFLPFDVDHKEHRHHRGHRHTKEHKEAPKQQEGVEQPKEEAKEEDKAEKKHRGHHKKEHTSKLEAELALHFDAPTMQWLLREMAQNRDRAAASDKVYSMQDVHQLASKHELVATAGVTRHSCHGCRALLERYEADPTLLEPQANAQAA